MQRRCPKTLSEVDAFRRAWIDEGVLLEGATEKTQRTSVEALLAREDLPRRARRDLGEIQRRFKERDLTAAKDGRGPGEGNPHLCPWFAAASAPASRWLDLVRFDAWGTGQSLTGQPLEDPALYWEAVDIIAAARSEATAPKKEAS